MSKLWEKSYITVGTELIIPKTLLIEPTKASERLVATRYVGETDAGIIVDCEFKKSIGAHNPGHYKIMINWASIWCGQNKVCFTDGSLLRATLTKDRQQSVFVKEAK